MIGQAGRRRGRWWVLALLALGLVGLVGGVAELSTREADPDRIEIAGIGDAQRIFGGVPQAGDRLGPADAPVAIQLFDDLQCSDCRRHFLATVPPLVEDEVRTAEVRLEYRHYSFSPNPIQTGFLGAEAAAEQGYAWPYIYLFFRNQEQARRAGVDYEFLSAVAGSIPELELPEWRRYLEREGDPGGRIRERLAGYEELARELGIRASPAALVSGPGGTRTLQEAPSLKRILAAIEAVR